MIADLDFTIDVGPIRAAGYLVIRWRARGTYQGGLPGISDVAVGRPVSFSGTDILGVSDGRIAEYWVNSDTLLLLQQLQEPFMVAA